MEDLSVFAQQKSVLKQDEWHAYLKDKMSKGELITSDYVVGLMEEFM